MSKVADTVVLAIDAVVIAGGTMNALQVTDPVRSIPAGDLVQFNLRPKDPGHTVRLRGAETTLRRTIGTPSDKTKIDLSKPLDVCDYTVFASTNEPENVKCTLFVMISSVK